MITTKIGDNWKWRLILASWHMQSDDDDDNDNDHDDGSNDNDDNNDYLWS